MRTITRTNADNPYRISGRLVGGDEDILVPIKGGLSYRGPLSGLAGHMRDNDLNQPSGPAIIGGKLHRVYPCIIATPDTAERIGTFFGCVIEPGDGRSFGSRRHLLETAKAMRARGITLTAENFAWLRTEKEDVDYSHEGETSLQRHRRPAESKDLGPELPW